MNQRVVNAVAGRLSLCPPQRRSLEILDRLTDFVSPRKAVDREAALQAVNAEWPTDNMTLECLSREGRS